MLRPSLVAVYLLIPFAVAPACEQRPESNPIAFHLGPATLLPSGFFETIGMFRSATTGDSVSTNFGHIPLAASPSEFLASAAHSRIQMCGQAGNLSGYVETDFLNAVGKEPYHFRQYWGEYRIGKWRILGGQAWSLLRPNRLGINSERDLMNSLVVEPAYHAGLAGSRNRQLRITRDEGNWQMALAYESGKNFLGKLSHDSHRLHLEGIGLGSVHRRAVSAAAVIHTGYKFDLVSQEVVSHGIGPQLLNTLPGGVSAYSTIQGIEARILPRLELFAYGGIVYGGSSAGNRTVREWTAGFIRHLFQEQPWGAATLGAQFSQMDRSTWSGGQGSLNYVQISFRYSLPASRSPLGVTNGGAGVRP